ncbi:MAG TPA: NAD(P)H-dependent oxidoreductase [Cellvibrionaceae bacterium]
MLKPLIISGHPDLKASHANTTILNALKANYPAAEFRELDSLYADFTIDVAAEQRALINADIIIMQAPFYWYSLPALLKKWLDDVFSYNFAYGSNGDKLKGKHFILSLTMGGPENSYSTEGYNNYEIEALLLPIKQTAQLAGMIYHSPIYSCGMIYIPGVYGDLPIITEKALTHAQRLSDQINSLQK